MNSSQGVRDVTSDHARLESDEIDVIDEARRQIRTKLIMFLGNTISEKLLLLLSSRKVGRLPTPPSSSAKGMTPPGFLLFKYSDQIRYLGYVIEYAIHRAFQHTCRPKTRSPSQHT